MSNAAFTATSAFALDLQTRAAEKIAAGGGIKALAEKKSDAFALNPFAISVLPDFNCRDFTLDENIEHKNRIKSSIQSRGYDRSKPVEVFQGKDKNYYLVDGETRLRSVIELINEGVEITSIPVIISEGKNDAERLAAQFTSNMGKNFNEIEAARGIGKLIGFGWDDAKIADRTALTPAKVTRLKAVLELPEAIVAMIRKGTVAVTFALETYKNAKTADEAIETLKKGEQAAVALGRSKVTKKHVPTGKVTPKKALVNFATDLGSAERTEAEDGVNYFVSKEMAARIDAMIAEYKEQAKKAAAKAA